MTLDYLGRADACTIPFPQSLGGLRSSLFASPPGGWGSFVFEHASGSIPSNDERSMEAMH